MMIYDIYIYMNYMYIYMIYHNYPEGFVIWDVVVWPILVQSQATGGDLQRLSWQKGLQRGGPGAAVPCGAASTS